MTDTTEKPAEVVVAEGQPKAEEPKPVVKLEGEALREALLKQIDYYFSRANLSNDPYLVNQMDTQMFVPVATICNFKLMKSLTEDQSLILEVMKSSTNVVLNDEGTHLRPNFKNERTTIILRDIPSATPVEEVKALFMRKPELVQPTTVRSDIGDHWFIQFDKEDDCVASFMWLQSQKFLDKPISARIKSENILRGLYTAADGGVPDGNYGRGGGGGRGGMNYGRGEMAYGLIPVPVGGRGRPPFGGGRTKVGGVRTPGASANAARPASGDASTNGARPKAKKGAKKTREGVKTVSAAEGAVVLNHPSFQLGMAAFPPLPGEKRAVPKPSGYQKEFKKYTRDEMVELVKKLAADAGALGRPDGMADDCGVVLGKPDTGLEHEKPLPPPISMTELYGTPGEDDDDDEEDEPRARRQSKEKAPKETSKPSGKQSEPAPAPAALDAAVADPAAVAAAAEAEAAAKVAAAEEVEKKKQEAAEKKAEASKTSYAAMLKKSESAVEKKEPAK